jgi:hypothetical protein
MNTRIRELTLYRAGLWRCCAAAAALLRGVTGHASLRSSLSLHHNGALVDAAGDGSTIIVGDALAALVAADAPALRFLSLTHASLGECVLAALLHALAANTRLDGLALTQCGISVAFARDTLAPALRANRGLRNLYLNADDAMTGAHAAHAALLQELNVSVRERTWARVALSAAALLLQPRRGAP